MKLSGDWLTSPATQAVFACLNGAGYEAFAVGGCVRNALIGAPVDDIDIATNARPTRVIELAEAAGLKAVPTGIDHGTITVVSKGIPHEITTYRADVETDGRHAVVQFSDTMQEDAQRRDFTMNALYADANGAVHDPVHGLPDLEARFVRFINDPEQRIREDYLRILRFFRFNAWYADPEGGFDPEALHAIASNLDGLSQLSRERVGSEMTKLLRAPDPAPAVAVMAQTGVLLALLDGGDPKPLAPLVHLEQSLSAPPDALRRLAALGLFDGAALRLPKAAQRRLDLTRTLIGDLSSAEELAYRHGKDMARDVLLLRAALFETELQPGLDQAIDTGASARFPISAKDLMPKLQGAALGQALKRLEDLWIASGFAMTKEALLQEV